MSGRKSQLPPYHLIVDGDMSGDITSTSTNVLYLDNIGIQMDFTGTPTGTFYVDASLDQSVWTPIEFSTPPVAAGVAGNIYLDINQHSASWMRVRYVRTSGTGTLNVKISAKQV